MFIVLRKKKLIFVHWYHHFVTLITAWWGYKNMVIAMGWNAGLNLIIHCFTYSYYTVTAMGIRVPRPLAMLLTTAQMVQMTGFVIITLLIIYWRDNKFCNFTWPMFFVSWGLYFTLLALFFNFFIKTYLSSAQKSKLN